MRQLVLRADRLLFLKTASLIPFYFPFLVAIFSIIG